ncbi:uncharacterized protein L969DRAFT_16986 [Mixia osmundae IAM 14324]|uniref:Uncharacterized protein n=1 Tax=Mixia osmundae (strain CBS 9802 / IAM 14324 / JCM 22182 / KY 12970) TaxID=764103 RepID=G7DVE2_MIXOS|nr:uncharacterized protein L969DRAFT_16986 [Mixia osmundae IAM 14324]KEI40330.1 hypothetical protein L969DRAFT_16986 [Mixia osmundae IAM 14324]GAA94552.1 hypothetical protein E5Q_01204 [Mixia osmundae IAM 14324]
MARPRKNDAPSYKESPISGSDDERSAEEASKTRARIRGKGKLVDDDDDDDDAHTAEEVSDSESMASSNIDDDPPPPKKKRRSPNKPAKATAKVAVQEADADKDGDDSDDRVIAIKKIVPGPSTAPLKRIVEPSTLAFLGDLTIPERNDREWFAENKARYDHALANWLNFVDHVQTVMARADEQLPVFPAKRLVGRIYRDIRFSQNKTPYNTFFQATMSRSGKKGPYAGYFLLLKPGATTLYCGKFDMDRNDLATIRTNILNDSGPLKRVVSQNEFVAQFGPPIPPPVNAVVPPKANGKRKKADGAKEDSDGEPVIEKVRVKGKSKVVPVKGDSGTATSSDNSFAEDKGKAKAVSPRAAIEPPPWADVTQAGDIQGRNIYASTDRLKIAPKIEGVDKNHPEIELLKLKSFVAAHNFSDAEVISADFDQKIFSAVQAGSTLVHLLNELMLPQSRDDSTTNGAEAALPAPAHPIDVEETMNELYAAADARASGTAPRKERTRPNTKKKKEAAGVTT